MDCYHHVGDYGEGHGGPNNEILVFGSLHLKFKIYRWIFNLLIAKSNFSVAEGCLTMGTVSNNVVAFA